MGMKRNMARHAAPAGSKHGRKTKSRYVPALDGLRAFAVLAVIAYHMGLGWAPGGLMGVTVFFVISGYLINGLLVAERDQTGTISLTSFWLRRVRRLFPAIFLSVVGTAALCTVFDHTLLDKMRPDILPSLLFYNNWWQIFRDISYFEAAGNPSPLTHFWSLSIEEQFYVMWPLLLLLMYRLGAKKQTMSRVVLVLAAASAVAMAVLYDPQGDPSRIYYGTDTRAMSLLVGVWLAFMWPSAAFGDEPSVDSRNASTWIGFNAAGVASLAGLVAIVVLTNGFSAFPYRGGILLTSVLSAVLIAVLAVPKTWVARFFALSPLVWIGKRSYGMYLWHFPILLLTTDVNSTTGTPWWMHIVQLVLIFVVAELSFRFVEDPIRKGKIGEWWRARRDAGAQRDVYVRRFQRDGSRTAAPGRAQTRRDAAAQLGPAAIVPAGCFAVLLIVACIGIFVVQPTDYADTYANAGAGGQSAQDRQSEAVAQADAENEENVENAENASDALAASSGASAAAATYDEAFGIKHLNAVGAQVYEPLLIGDSISAGAIDAFYETYPYGFIDALVNRNIWESTYGDYLESDQVGDYVVFCLGTNNAVVDWQIDELLAPVSANKTVVMVNTRNTQDWCQSTNEQIMAAPDRYDNVITVDWYAASEGHDEYFAGDGTHLTDEGAHAYIALIDEALRSSFE